MTHTFAEVSVHDPAIVQGDDGEYYIFGSHLAVAKTSDLMNWEYVNQGVKNQNDVIPDVYHQMEEAFEWSHSNTFWAPRCDSAAQRQIIDIRMPCTIATARATPPSAVWVWHCRTTSTAPMKTRAFC